MAQQETYLNYKTLGEISQLLQQRNIIYFSHRYKAGTLGTAGLISTMGRSGVSLRILQLFARSC